MGTAYSLYRVMIRRSLVAMEMKNNTDSVPRFKQGLVMYEITVVKNHIYVVLIYQTEILFQSYPSPFPLLHVLLPMSTSLRVSFDNAKLDLLKSEPCNLTCIMSYVRRTKPQMKCTTFLLGLMSGIKYDLQKCEPSNELIRWTKETTSLPCVSVFQL